MLGPQAKKFVDNIQKILKSDKNNLIHRESWGTANFSKYEEVINEIFFFVNTFSMLDISFIPDSYFLSINENLAQITNIIIAIENFDVSKTNKTDIDAKCNTLNPNFDKLKPFLATWLPILVYKKDDIDKKISWMDAAILDIAHRNEQIINLQASFEKESSEILQNMRETSANCGISIFNKDFENAAQHNQADATYWGYWLVGLSIVTILFPIIAYIWTPTYESLVVLISSKILVMAVLITASLWVGRMYKSSKHQEAVNLFKANALRTFQAFINATDDEQTKNAVLLETTKAIFTGFNPGYISTEPTASDSLKIMEIFKNIPQKE